MQGLSKIHKPLVNVFPKLKPILSAIITGTYKWANFFLFLFSNRLLLTIIQVRTPLISPKTFFNKVPNFLWLPLMWIPFSQTCHLMKLLCVNELFKSSETVLGLKKQQVLEMLSFLLSMLFILFDQKYYSRIDGVAMGSPLGPTLAVIFLCYHETTWLKNCTKSFKPLYYKRYVNDILLLFEKPDQVYNLLIT